MDKRQKDVVATAARERLARPDVPDRERAMLREAYDARDCELMRLVSPGVRRRGDAFGLELALEFALGKASAVPPVAPRRVRGS